MKISLFGTGLMGKPMGKRLIDAGHDLTVYNRTKSKTEELKNAGAKVADHPDNAVKASDVLITMLSDYNAVSGTLFKETENNFRGKKLIQMSTITPSESILLKDRIEALGGEYLEAPVLGSTPQATNGELIIMVGAAENQFKEFKTIFETLGKKIILMGEVGKASSTKLAMNQLIASLAASFSTSLAFAREKEVDLEKFMDILRASPLYAKAFDAKLENYLNDNYEPVHFPVKHLLKDVNLFLDESRLLKINSSIPGTVKHLLQDAIDDKHGEKDYSAIYKAIHLA